MKKCNLAVVSLTLVSVLLSIFLACAPPSSPPASPGAQAPARAPAKSDWELLVEAGKADRQLQIYAGSIGAGRDAIIQGFGGKYGIEIDIVQGRGTEIAQKMDRERKAGLYLVDVGIQGPTTFFGQIQPMNVALPLEPLLVLPEVKDTTKWRGGRIPFVDKNRTAVAPVATVVPFVAINTEMVKENEIASYNDLLAAKWKGKIVINDPSVPGNGPEWFAYVMLVAFGSRQNGEEFTAKLVAQEPVVLRDQRLMVEWVARGKYPVGVAFDQAEMVKMMKTGAPIKFVRIKEGSTFTPGPGLVTVLDKAPHPNAAKLFINWVLSKEGVAAISPAFGYPSQRLDVSNDSFDPIFIPASNDTLQGDDWESQKSAMMKVAAEMFKHLMQ